MTCRMVPPCCEKIQNSGPAPEKPCPAFSACLPFGAELSYDGGCLNYTAGTPPDDGVYSQIVIENGCIVGAELAPIPQYTATPCAPTPSGCSGSGSSGSGSGGTPSGLPSPSAQAGNLFTYDNQNLPLVKVAVAEGSGISVSGDGTEDDALTISLSRDTLNSITPIEVRGLSGVTVTHNATGSPTVYKVAHQAGVEGFSGRHGDYTIDNFGHVIDYTPSSSGTTVAGITAGDGVSVTADNQGVYTIAYNPGAHVANGAQYFGGNKVVLAQNRIVEIVRDIELSAGVYRLGNYDVTINEYGSITAITEVPVEDIDSTLLRSCISQLFTDAGELAENRDMAVVPAYNTGFRIIYTQSTAIAANKLTCKIDGGRSNKPDILIGGVAHFVIDNVYTGLDTHIINLHMNGGFQADGILDVYASTVGAAG